MADITVLEDGTEVCLPCPDSWSDSSSADEGTCGDAVGEANACGGRGASPCTQAFAILADIPSHNHSDRGLAAGQAAAALDALASLPPRDDQAAPRLLAGDTSAAEFAAAFVGGDGRPAVVTGIPEAEGWPACARWRTQEEFLRHHGSLPVQVTEMCAAHGLGRPYRVELTLDEYAGYAASNDFDWPFYVWERNFSGCGRQRLLDDWSVPSMFADDLYDTTADIRNFLPLSCHLFLLVGGRRTGSNMHLDPKWSSAWNTLLCGRKRWVMFPRGTPASEIGALEGDAYKDGGPQAYWWLDHYPRLRAEGARLGMVDIVQCPGDTVFVPAGWWHATLNLPAQGEHITVACTRNVVPPASLPFVLPLMRAADPAFARAFVDTLRRVRDDAGSFLPEEEQATERPELVGDCEAWQLRRRQACSLSLAACRRNFIAAGAPLIVDGLGPHMLSEECCGLSREWLSSNFGEKCVAVRRGSAPGSDEGRVDLMRLREALALLRRGGPDAEGLYIYDLSLPLQLPGLLEHVRVPRYFAHCYLQQTMRLHCFSRSWPTFFIGAAASQSTLHVDQWHGHFWMYMVSGRKRWTIFHPEDAHLLNPAVPPGMHHPVFPSLEELEGSEGLRKARKIEVVLEEGEVLFVPGGAPHAVLNLTDSVAVAGNFLDESNLGSALADLRAMADAERDRAGGEVAQVGDKSTGGGCIADVVTAVDEIDFEPGLGMHEELLDPRQLVVRYRDFVGGAAARWPAQPPVELDDC